jgi:hypothetical protein
VVIENKILMVDRKPPAKRRKTGEPSAPKDQFQCPACDKNFDTELGMTRHLFRSPKCCASIFLSHQHKTLSEIQDTKQLRQGNQNLNAELELAAPEEPTNEDKIFVNFENSEDLEDEHRAVEQDEKKNADYLCYLTNDLVEIDLLKILHDSNSPHYLFKEILEWGKRSSDLKYDFNPKRKDRKSMIAHLDKWMGLKHLNPIQVPITLPGPNPSSCDQVSVTSFDFKGMLKSLLTDKDLFGNIDNLDVNTNNPFSKYDSRNKHISCANGASWYKAAWDHLCKDTNDLLVPIIFACDETKMGKCGACPLLFTTSLLNQSC